MSVQAPGVSGPPAACALTEYQRSLLQRIMDGRVLCCEMREDGPHFWIEGDRWIPRASARALIASGKVVPMGDGAFGTSQTYRPVSAS